MQALQQLYRDDEIKDIDHVQDMELLLKPVDKSYKLAGKWIADWSKISSDITAVYSAVYIYIEFEYAYFGGYLYFQGLWYHLYGGGGQRLIELG